VFYQHRAPVFFILFGQYFFFRLGFRGRFLFFRLGLGSCWLILRRNSWRCCVGGICWYCRNNYGCICIFPIGICIFIAFARYQSSSKKESTSKRKKSVFHKCFVLWNQKYYKWFIVL